MFNPRIVAFSVCLAAIALEPVASAGIIVDVGISGSTGAFTYSYEFENQTTVSIFLFALNVRAGIDAVESPAGWVIDIEPISGGFETLVQWESADISSEVPPLGTLSGFVITSRGTPASVPFDASGHFQDFLGQTTGPLDPIFPSPEPPDITIVGGGLLVIALRYVNLQNGGELRNRGRCAVTSAARTTVLYESPVLES